MQKVITIGRKGAPSDLFKNFLLEVCYRPSPQVRLFTIFLNNKAKYYLRDDFYAAHYNVNGLTITKNSFISVLLINNQRDEIGFHIIGDSKSLDTINLSSDSSKINATIDIYYPWQYKIDFLLLDTFLCK